MNPLIDSDFDIEPDDPINECDNCGLMKLGCAAITTHYGLEGFLCPDCRGWNTDDYLQMDRGDWLYHNRDRS